MVFLLSKISNLVHCYKLNVAYLWAFIYGVDLFSYGMSLAQNKISFFLSMGPFEIKKMMVFSFMHYYLSLEKNHYLSLQYSNTLNYLFLKSIMQFLEFIIFFGEELFSHSKFRFFHFSYSNFCFYNLKVFHMLLFGVLFIWIKLLDVII